MDQLQQLVETLRVLARTNEPNRVALVEKAIDEYLNDKAAPANSAICLSSIKGGWWVWYQSVTWSSTACTQWSATQRRCATTS
jgi:hypothetical protein